MVHLFGCFDVVHGTKHTTGLSDRAHASQHMDDGRTGRSGKCAKEKVEVIYLTCVFKKAANSWSTTTIDSTPTFETSKRVHTYSYTRDSHGYHARKLQTENLRDCKAKSFSFVSFAEAHSHQPTMLECEPKNKDGARFDGIDVRRNAFRQFIAAKTTVDAVRSR